ncbi:MAG: TIGR01458 family HAD-type hydrolase [Solirubrobacteraceae bacterium]|nr:TIGR01458 family HAD-type hydrolase [Solirubrobacteraceae bacterium]
MPARWDALLLDIDGVLHVGDEAVPGAVDAIEQIKRGGVPFRLATNTTSRPRSAIADRLQRMGFDLDADDILSPASMAVRLCKERGYDRVALVVPHALREDLSELEAVESRGSAVDAVILGDLGRGFTWDILNGAFRSLLRGADLIALQRNRYWRRPEGLVLDAGPFVAALEYATDQGATVVGKPSPAYFHAAIDDLEANPATVAMIGDDLEADIGGALDAGIAGIQVRTGKFRPDALDEAGIQPTMLIDSVADVPALCGIAGSAFT